MTVPVQRPKPKPCVREKLHLTTGAHFPVRCKVHGKVCNPRQSESATDRDWTRHVQQHLPKAA